MRRRQSARQFSEWCPQADQPKVHVRFTEADHASDVSLRAGSAQVQQSRQTEPGPTYRLELQQNDPWVSFPAYNARWTVRKEQVKMRVLFMQPNISFVDSCVKALSVQYHS